MTNAEFRFLIKSITSGTKEFIVWPKNLSPKQVIRLETLGFKEVEKYKKAANEWADPEVDFIWVKNDQAT